MTRRPLSWDRAGLERLAQAQDSVLDRTALARLGVTSQHIAHRVGTGRWRAVGPRVVVLHTGPLTERQRRWAAVLHSGPDAALRGLSAAAAGGLEGFPSPVVHTVVPHGAYAVNLDTDVLRVRVRQSRLLDAAALHPVASPPRQSMPVALVEAGSDAASPDRARLLVLAAVQQRLVRSSDMRAILDVRPRARQRGLLLEAVDDAAGGVHSLPEREWTLSTRRAGLPEPTRQRRVQRANGTWYLDAWFARWLVAVEINGAQHGNVTLAESDDHRRNVLGTAGQLVLTVSSHAVRHSSVPALATAAALLSRGWEPGRRIRLRLERMAREAGLDLATGDWLRLVEVA